MGSGFVFSHSVTKKTNNYNYKRIFICCIYIILRKLYVFFFILYIYFSCFIRSDVTPVRFCAFIRRQQTRKGVWKNVITFRAGSFLYIVWYSFFFLLLLLLSTFFFHVRSLRFFVMATEADLWTFVSIAL